MCLTMYCFIVRETGQQLSRQSAGELVSLHSLLNLKGTAEALREAWPKQSLAGPSTHGQSRWFRTIAAATNC